MRPGAHFGVVLKILRGSFYFIPTLRYKFLECKNCWDVEIIVGNLAGSFIRRCHPPSIEIEQAKEKFHE